MNILGVDNGVGGALTFYDGVELLVYDMPTYKIAKRNPIDILRLIEIIKTNAPDHVYIEKLTPYMGSKLSFFSMGHSEGLLLGVLTCLQIPYTLVRPNDWKKPMGCTKDKDAARQRASQLLPQFAHNWDRKKDIDRAESALIALYGYKKEK